MGIEVIFLCRFNGIFFTGVNPDTDTTIFGFASVTTSILANVENKS